MTAAWFVAAGAVCISFAAPLVTAVDVGASASAFYRMLFGSAILFGWVLIRAEDRANWRRGWLASLIAGVVFAADLWLWHRSINWVGPGIATLLANLQVLVLAMVGWLLLRESAGWRLWAGIVAALVGLWLLVGVGWSGLTDDFRSGVWFGLATAVAYASYVLVLRHSQQAAVPLSPVLRLFQVTLCCGVVLFAVTVLEGDSLVIPTVVDGVYLVLLGLLAQVFGWVLISRGLPHLAASLIGLLILLQPALAFVWDLLFFDLNVTALQLFGFGLALAGIYAGSVANRQR